MNRIVTLRLAFDWAGLRAASAGKPWLYGHDEADFARPTIQLKLFWR
jgi:hypothetical protein